VVTVVAVPGTGSSPLSEGAVVAGAEETSGFASVAMAETTVAAGGSGSDA
jgi:hypothetical protein